MQECYENEHILIEEDRESKACASQLRSVISLSHC